MAAAKGERRIEGDEHDHHAHEHSHAHHHGHHHDHAHTHQHANAHHHADDAMSQEASSPRYVVIHHHHYHHNGDVHHHYHGESKVMSKRSVEHEHAHAHHDDHHHDHHHDSQQPAAFQPRVNGADLHYGQGEAGTHAPGMLQQRLLQIEMDVLSKTMRWLSITANIFLHKTFWRSIWFPAPVPAKAPC